MFHSTVYRFLSVLLDLRNGTVDGDPMQPMARAQQSRMDPPVIKLVFPPLDERDERP